MTAADTTSTAPAAVWDKDVRRLTETIDKRVSLTGAPTVIYQGRKVQPVRIMFAFFRRDGGPWSSTVTIYADRPGSLTRDWFYPTEIHPPAWLTDLIAEAHPPD